MTSSIISIEIRPDLLSFAGISEHNRNIKVKCVAVLGTKYHRSNEISVETFLPHLQTKRPDPEVPKRVRALGGPVNICIFITMSWFNRKPNKIDS